ncbi:gp54 protein [Mycobacteroides abscessus subsp. abscessus]|uniref:AAA family ATPase n=1 Tax=Mycobacteroides abscessus TaxID=36809 RepID=UPI0009265A68|nr:AAA family ATPase [Mycobacteroides abscessus]SHT84428.1 gp54 protein [Mycobacteroides abscessus subsp. abscessus]SKO51547.1 gp54 protein [Mycobacteroides abscessus subsp. abscessus]
MLGSSAITAVLGSGVDNTNHAAVRSFINSACEAGLSVLLVVPGTKQPFDGRTPAKRKAEDKAAQLAAKEAGRRDWSKAKSPSGLALATSTKTALTRKGGYLDRYIEAFGADCAVNIAVEVGGSRLVIVDCDTLAQKRSFLDIATGDADSQLPPTVVTPGSRDAEGNWVHSDGGHFWFTVPDGVEMPTNIGSLTWGGTDGFAVLWDRRYVLIPPSTRPEGAYEMVGRDYECPAWLLEVINEKAAARTSRTVENAVDGELSSSIDEWAETISWDDILEPLGWTPTVRPDNCGCPVWTAPGEHSSPKSATAHDSGCTLGRYTETNAPLHIWTDHDIEPFDEYVSEYGTNTLSKLQAIAYTSYEGSIGKAMDGIGISPAVHEIERETGVNTRDIGAEEAGHDPGEEITLPACGASDGVDVCGRERGHDGDHWALNAGGAPCIAWSSFTDSVTGTVIPADDMEHDEFPSDDFVKTQIVAIKRDLGEYERDTPDPAASCDTCGEKLIHGTTHRDSDNTLIHTNSEGDVHEAESPFADADPGDPAVFEPDIQGVPMIAPFSHWRDMPPPQYVIDKLIEHGGLASLIGPPGVGKSSVALDMACHIAVGKAWRGRKVLKTRVLYLPGEGLSGAVQRVKAWEAQHDINDSALDDGLRLGNSIIQLGASTEAWGALAEYVIRERIGLIIFDTFARMSLGIEENSATEMGRAVVRFDQMRRLTNAGVLIVHHTGKNNPTSGRGSSALNAALDSELLVSDGTWEFAPESFDDEGRPPSGKKIQLSTTKQKNAEQMEEAMPLLMRSDDQFNAPYITGPNGSLDPMQGHIEMARPVEETVIETAVRIRKFVDQFTEQGVTRADIASGVRPDPYTARRKDSPKAWKHKVHMAIDNALRWGLLETASGQKLGARYVPGPMGVEASRAAYAAEVLTPVDGEGVA